MVSNDPIALVQAIVGAELSSSDLSGDQSLPKGCVVTVARDFGSGGKLIAEQLAQRLGVRCFDREVIDAIARDAKVDKYLMERLDEHVRSTFNDWAHTVISGKNAFKEDYHRHLVNVIIGIAHLGGVIVGRGAHLILDPKNTFRVRIVGSCECCAERVAASKGLSNEAARTLVQHVNHERNEFIKRTFNCEWHELGHYDLVLNTDRFSQEQCVALIVAAMETAGFAVPPTA